MANKSSFADKRTIQRVQPVFLFFNFSCHIKTGNQPQWDLVRYGYKTNKEVKIMAILLHVGEPIEPVN